MQNVKSRDVVWAERGSSHILLRVVKVEFHDGRTARFLEGYSEDDAMGNPIWKNIEIDETVLQVIGA